MNCPICKNPSNQIAYAVVAPWISELLKEQRRFSSLIECATCDFRFFSARYSDEQVQKIYSSYRQENYFECRNSWEPWYQKSENALYNPELGRRNVQERRKRMEFEIYKAGVKSDFMNALDYGGDSGQFFPDGVKGKKYLLEVSDLPGDDSQIKVVNSVTEIPKSSIDLVMACMLIEHLSEFHDFLRELKVAMSKNATLYIELPLDKFETHSFHNSKIYLKWLGFLLKRKRSFIIVDFMSGVWRNFFGKIPFFGIVKQSEHINYFDTQSIAKLLHQHFHLLLHLPK